MYVSANHLGNVLVTVSDKKIPIADPNNTANILYYTADVITAGDYAPFGMGLVGRKFSSGKYRYGFNGKEDDKDAGEGIQDYGMRVYSERLGRFLSVDPITKNYPELTPYQFASNRPIDGIDEDGLEFKSFQILNGSQELVFNMISDGVTKGSENKNSGGSFFRGYMEGSVARGMKDLAIPVATGFVGGAYYKPILKVTGYVYTFYMTQRVVGVLNEPAHTPAEAKEKLEQIKGIAAEAFVNYGIGKIVGVSTRLISSAGKAIYKTFSSSSIRFSQSSVNGLDEIVTSMKANGWKGDPIDIVKMKDNIYTTVDNTRLLAAQKAGINVKAVAHNYDDVIPEEMAKRFLNKQWAAPKTWGEAVENRIQNQNKQFRTNNTNGSFVEPKANTKTGTGGG